MPDVVEIHSIHMKKDILLMFMECVWLFMVGDDCCRWDAVLPPGCVA